MELEANITDSESWDRITKAIANKLKISHSKVERDIVEIGKEISKFLNIPLINDILFKIKETLPQVELSEKEREENIKGVFIIRNRKKISGKKILLVDDVYTTGSTMKECAQLLKKAGAKEVIGIVIARAAPGQDR